VNSTRRRPAWEATLERLVRDRGSALARYAFFLSGSAEEAADLVQEGIVKTFSRLRAGGSIDSAEAYTRRAILNTYIDQGRRRTRARDHRHLVADEVMIGSHSEDTDVAIDLQHALMLLSPRQRACLVLRYYEDMKLETVAEVLELKVGTVKRYVTEALARLSTVLYESEFIQPIATRGEADAYRA
jgi:RNA polymerase sigma factor (sigma-70 family)